MSTDAVVEDFEDVVFKVQLAASSKKIDPSPENFKKLSPLSRNLENDLYKYYFGETNNYIEAQNLKDKAKAQGYTSAFIVAFDKDAKKISIKEALKTKADE